MRIVFVRHAQPRSTERDPPLTANGWRMAIETAQWVHEQKIHPALLVSSPAARARETAEALVEVFPNVRRELGSVGTPELPQDWFDLVSDLAVRLGHRVLPGFKRPLPDLDVALVGHHPTLDLIRRLYAPLPRPIPRDHYAQAIILGGDRIDALCCLAAWPGRPG